MEKENWSAVTACSPAQKLSQKIAIETAYILTDSWLNILC